MNDSLFEVALFAFLILAVGVVFLVGWAITRMPGDRKDWIL